MIYLIIVSLLWAFSFGLIKGNLTGLDSNFVAFARMLVSFVFFLPFLRLKGVKKETAFKLLLVGAIQFGLMYLFYIYAFQFLKSYEVALYTIFTPLFVSLIHDLQNKKFNQFTLVTAALSVAGAAVVAFRHFPVSGTIFGFILVQAANLCFAFGQVYYKKIMAQEPSLNQLHIFGILFAGAVFVTLLSCFMLTDMSTISLSWTQFSSLIYLGAISSGLGFFLWNLGATKTNVGTLAVFNNLKIPTAIAVSLFVFGESADILQLSIGGTIILIALLLAKSSKTSQTFTD